MTQDVPADAARRSLLLQAAFSVALRLEGDRTLQTLPFFSSSLTHASEGHLFSLSTIYMRLTTSIAVAVVGEERHSLADGVARHHRDPENRQTERAGPPARRLPAAAPT